MTDQTLELDAEHGETVTNDWCTRCEKYTEWDNDTCAEECGKVWGYE